MPHLLDAVSITETAPAAWSRGPNPVEYIDRAFATNVVDICSPPEPLAVLPDVSLGEDMRPFAIVGYSRVPTRCVTLPELETAVGNNMARATEYTAAQHLWYGSGVDGDEVFINHTDVETVTATGNPATDLAAVLARAYELNPHITPLVHLGTASALHLALGLQNLTVAWVTSPAYPINAIAVTDAAIEVIVSPIETTTATEIDINKHQLEQTRLCRIAFDITKTVRAA